MFSMHSLIVSSQPIYYYYPHFLDEKTEVYRGSKVFPKSCVRAMNGTLANPPPGPRLITAVPSTSPSWLHAHFVDGENKAWRSTVTSLGFELGGEAGGLVIVLGQ